MNFKWDFFDGKLQPNKEIILSRCNPISFNLLQQFSPTNVLFWNFMANLEVKNRQKFEKFVKKGVPSRLCGPVS